MSEPTVRELKANIETIFKQFKELKQDVKDLKENQISRNENNIREMQAMKDMMSDLLDKKLDPIYSRLNEQDKRIQNVEQRPQAYAVKALYWLVGIFGSLTISLLGYLASVFWGM